MSIYGKIKKDNTSRRFSLNFNTDRLRIKLSLTTGGKKTPTPFSQLNQLQLSLNDVHVCSYSSGKQKLKKK